jgi:hypothetical protein
LTVGSGGSGSGGEIVITVGQTSAVGDGGEIFLRNWLHTVLNMVALLMQTANAGLLAAAT